MAWLCISYYLKLSSIVSRTTVAGFSRIIIILCWSSMRNPFFLDSNTMSCLSLFVNLVLLGVDIFNVLSNDHGVWIACHTLSSWMTFYQCEFFDVLPNDHGVWISCHTLSSWMTLHQCEFFDVLSNDHGLLNVFFALSCRSDLTKLTIW